MTPEEQQLLAAQALQSVQTPQPGLPDAALQGYSAQPGLSPDDQRALAEGALQGYGMTPPPPAPVAAQPSMSLQEQQALVDGATQGYAGAPPAPAPAPESAQWTDPNQPGPGAVTDQQMLAASAPPAAAMAAVPPSAAAATEQPVAPPVAEAAPAEPPARPERPAARTFQEGLDNYVAESVEAGESEKQKAKAEHDGALATANLTKEQAADVTERLKRHNAFIDEQVEDIRRTKAKMEAAQEKADASSHIGPKEESLRSRIGGLLMLTGGLMGDALARLSGDNTTRYQQEMQANLDKAVQLDLAQQREQYNNDKEGAKRAESNYAHAVDIFGKTPEADEFTQILTAQQYTAEMAAQTAQAKSEVVRLGGKVLKESRDAETAKDVAGFLAGVARARLSGAGRAAADNKVYVIQEIRDKKEAHKPLTAKELALLNADDASQRGERGTTLREETAEEKTAAAQAKVDAAAALERAEVIPGLVRRPNLTPLSPKEQGEIRAKFRSTTGVQFMTNRVAGLWDTVMDKSLPEATRQAARTEFAAAKARLLSGDSVDTGQGTITASDAQRMGSAWPDLPTNLGEIPYYFKNVWKGEMPSAATYRAYGENAMKQTRTELTDAYGLLPAEEGNRLWAEYDAKKAPKKPAASAEGKSAPKPAREGMVKVIRVSDGATGDMAPEKAKELIASGKYKAAE